MPRSQLLVKGEGSLHLEDVLKDTGYSVSLIDSKIVESILFHLPIFTSLSPHDSIFLLMLIFPH